MRRREEAPHPEGSPPALRLVPLLGRGCIQVLGEWRCVGEELGVLELAPAFWRQLAAVKSGGESATILQEGTSWAAARRASSAPQSWSKLQHSKMLAHAGGACGREEGAGLPAASRGRHPSGVFRASGSASLGKFRHQLLTGDVFKLPGFKLRKACGSLLANPTGHHV